MFIQYFFIQFVVFLFIIIKIKILMIKINFQFQKIAYIKKLKYFCYFYVQQYIKIIYSHSNYIKQKIHKVLNKMLNDNFFFSRNFLNIIKQEQGYKINKNIKSINSKLKKKKKTKTYINIYKETFYIEIRNGVYEGQLYQNKRQGKGIFIWDDSSVYVGEWFNDLCHGEGILFLKNGCTLYGQFDYGNLNGKTIIKFANNNMIFGIFRQNQLKGISFFYNQNNQEWKMNNFIRQSNQKFRLFQGYIINIYRLYLYEFYLFLKKNSLMHGLGRVYSENGLIYDGQFENGHLNGKGYLYNSTNDIFYEGFFYENECNKLTQKTLGFNQQNIYQWKLQEHKQSICFQNKIIVLQISQILCGELNYIQNNNQIDKIFDINNNSFSCSKIFFNDDNPFNQFIQQSIQHYQNAKFNFFCDLNSNQFHNFIENNISKSQNLLSEINYSEIIAKQPKLIETNEILQSTLESSRCKKSIIFNSNIVKGNQIKSKSNQYSNFKNLCNKQQQQQNINLQKISDKSNMQVLQKYQFQNQDFNQLNNNQLETEIQKKIQNDNNNSNQQRQFKSKVFRKDQKSNNTFKEKLQEVYIKLPSSFVQ
ncbi:hypothetical protein IMG5_000510 [Ichthyophthirius multifiliis]|uniref:MORN repeat protein n=1 Tax=Ichthyophthirius multifiliis TaxID=5932 RepID=G0QIT8_ICHMU|nr:hypothetical protein IMG5_000510 [Ichthyophthirius multifiliis]EGR34824.1 hypothetical protein IMG5_000510 [Ichthyophthirius multifiliis]|eukprot:XP_004040128.1 hypothetical protein IMG5_000510 [Ichthyophthirius multifiliis]